MNFTSLSVILRVGSTARHTLLFKKHQQNDESSGHGVDLPADRTLFVIQLPLCSTISGAKESLKALFKTCGRVEAVHLKFSRKSSQVHSLDFGAMEVGSEAEDDAEVEWDLESQAKLNQMIPVGTSAYVVFKSAESVDKAMEMAKLNKKRYWFKQDDEGKRMGMSAIYRYKLQYMARRPDREAFKAEVEEAIQAYDESEQMKREEIEAMHNKPDADGWIKVTRSSRRHTNTDGKITVTSAHPEEMNRLKPKEKVATDFYRFQKHQQKVDKYTELRKKFEEDKKRIASMKAARKFRPY